MLVKVVTSRGHRITLYTQDYLEIIYMPTIFLSFEISSITLETGFILCTKILIINFHAKFKAKIPKEMMVIIIADKVHS